MVLHLLSCRLLTPMDQCWSFLGKGPSPSLCQTEKLESLCRYSDRATSAVSCTLQVRMFHSHITPLPLPSSSLPPSPPPPPSLPSLLPSPSALLLPPSLPPLSLCPPPSSLPSLSPLSLSPPPSSLPPLSPPLSFPPRTMIQ